jgi:hypothetical protein
MTFGNHIKQEFSIPDQKARQAKAIQEKNQRVLNIDSIYNPIIIIYNPMFVKGKTVLVKGEIIEVLDMRWFKNCFNKVHI